MSENCSQCGAMLEAEEIFCSECGCKVKDILSPAPVEVDSHKEDDLSPAFNTESCNNSPINTNKTATLPRSQDPTPTQIRIVSAQDKAEFYSDCNHFSLEWNQGASVFLTGAGSSFQFRVKPLNQDAMEASDFCFYLKFPGEDRFKKYDPRLHRLRSARTVNFNYQPKHSSMGVAQNVDLYFSYKIKDIEYCYDQQLLIDIYPQNEQSDKVLENLTIKISDIKQEGNASDHQLNILKGLDLNHGKTSVFELLEKLKKVELWVPLEMFQGMSMNSSVRETMVIPSAPVRPCSTLVLECDNGTKIYLFNKEISAGRSRKADMLIRHEAPEGVSWDIERMKHMNLKLSGIHCQTGIDTKGAWVSDLKSTNGTYLEGERIFNKKNYLESQKEYQLSLASPMAKPYNLPLFLRVYSCPEEHLNKKNQSNTAGIVIKRKDRDSEAYLLVNRWLPLSSVLPDAANFFVSYRDNNFAISDGRVWHWLEPGKNSLPQNCGIAKVSN